MRAGLLVAVLLAGCATDAPREVAVLSSAPSTTVQVPLGVACVDAKDVPPAPATAMPPRGSDIGREAAGASADVRALRAQNAQLRAMLLACASAPTTTK